MNRRLVSEKSFLENAAGVTNSARQLFICGLLQDRKRIAAYMSGNRRFKYPFVNMTLFNEHHFPREAMSAGIHPDHIGAASKV